ncbi:hypothetical protein [Kitasatospora sp. NPDC059571]|uniref:hypothetical protein n=1 Tax=Kitasatospora sp. NPDC059571 TaxID=3346871 RepID=UPI00368CD821
MTDLSIDYGLLANLASTARKAADLLQQMSGSTASAYLSDDGRLSQGGTSTAELGRQLDDFHSRWSTALSNAADKAKSLGDLTDQLAKEWFDADAGFAAQFLAKISSVRGELLEYRTKHPLSAEEEQQLPDVLRHVGWYAKTLPGGASQAAIRHPDGTTVITVNGPTGLLYSQTIRADAGNAHMAIRHGDGRTQTIDLVRNPDGSQTQTVVADGKTTVFKAAPGSDDFTQVSGSDLDPKAPTPLAPAGSNQSYW